MRAGDVVGGYTILEDFKVVGAGLSKWTFAERDGREYFIKEFLSPTYPDDDAPGSAKTKARKRARCAAFEAHHRGIQEALAPVSGFGGNLIVTLDFFRCGAKYYKVTEKVDVASLEPSGDRRTRILEPTGSAQDGGAHSLKILHDLSIVHSDLKPSNVLIKRTEFGHTTKLIDFDSAYRVGSPPPPDEIVGTMNYYSPELVAYIQETGPPDRLTQKSDIFALGLIYVELLTGSLPPFDYERYRYPSVAVTAGETLRLPTGTLPADVSEHVDRMMLVDPVARPSVGDVHATLMRVRPPLPAPPRAGRRERAAAASTTLKGKGLRAVGRVAEAVPPPPDTPSGRLIGKLLTRLKDTETR